VRIVKFLLHPVTLVVIVLVVAVYINRYTLFPEFSKSPEVRQYTDKVDSFIDTVNEGVTTITQTDSQDKGTEKKAEDTVATMEAPESEAEEASSVATNPVENDATPSVMESELTQPQNMAPEAMGNNMEAETLEESSPVEAEPAMKPVEESPQETVASNDVDEQRQSPIVVWESARRAAWQQDDERAVSEYQQLIALQPDNYDAYGEMGNVLLHKGDTEGAVDAYYKSAMLLSKAGYPQAAWSVLNIVSRLDQKRARELYEAIRTQQLGAARKRPVPMK